MSGDAVIKGCYADYRRVKGRKVLQLVIEVPLEQAPLVHEAFGEPDPAGDTWVAVALLKPESERVAAQKDAHRLSRQAAMCCQEGAFHQFLTATKRDLSGDGYEVSNAEQAAQAVRELCGVDSRSEFDRVEYAARKWRDLHGEYQAWLLV